MKIAVIDSLVNDFKGVPINEGTIEKPVYLSFKECFIRAMSAAPTDRSQIANVEDSSREYRLGLKVALATSETEFTVEEISSIKKKVCSLGFSSLISGQLCLGLDGTIEG